MLRVELCIHSSCMWGHNNPSVVTTLEQNAAFVHPVLISCCVMPDEHVSLLLHHSLMSNMQGSICPCVFLSVRGERHYLLNNYAEKKTSDRNSAALHLSPSAPPGLESRYCYSRAACWSIVWGFQRVQVPERRLHSDDSKNTLLLCKQMPPRQLSPVCVAAWQKSGPRQQPLLGLEGEAQSAGSLCPFDPHHKPRMERRTSVQSGQRDGWINNKWIIKLSNEFLDWN